MHYGIYLARLDIRITVTPDGFLSSTRTENKGYGGNDVVREGEQVERREGPLTRGQMVEVLGLFDAWDSLSSKPYAGVADGGAISIRYGDKTVSGGSDVPQQVRVIQKRLMELAESMPVVKS